MAEAEAPILWPPEVKNWLTGKDPDAGKDWAQEEKETIEDEMVGWCHQLDGHEFEQALGVGDGHGSLACCSPWGHTAGVSWTRLSAWTEYPKWFFWKAVSFKWILKYPSVAGPWIAQCCTKWVLYLCGWEPLQKLHYAPSKYFQVCSGDGEVTLFLFLLFLISFYWYIVDLQCCVSFRCSAKWLSYTCINSFLDSFPV